MSAPLIVICYAVDDAGHPDVTSTKRACRTCGRLAWLSMATAKVARARDPLFEVECVPCVSARNESVELLPMDPEQLDELRRAREEGRN